MAARRSTGGAWRSLTLVTIVALAGAAGTLLAGALLGMPAKDLGTLGWMLLSAALATVVAVAIARPLLERTTLRARFVAVAVIGAVVALANLAVLAQLMFVNDHDLALLVCTLVYAVGAGVGAALVIARSSSQAVGALTDTARRIGAGDLSARAGSIQAGPELEMLAATMDDMTGRLADALERERAIERTRRDLFTAVSHDLRTPLASLQAMVEAIDDGVVDDPPSLRRYAAEMRTSVAALASMVDDLFELAQIDAGAIERETQHVRLSDAVSAAVATCAHQAAEKGLIVRTDLATAADSPCSPRLERVLANLISNAIRHTPSDGTVLVEADRIGTAIEIAVEDAGPGIADADAPNVFEPFWRGDPARSGAAAGAGSGLGLTLAKRIIEALGGQIAVERPRHSGGARFAVVVPESSP